MGYQNFFATRLATDIGAADATITLETPPTITTGTLTLEARNSTKREIIKYTGVSGTQITGVTRGQGGTTATTHTKNSLVEMNLTAEDLTAALALAFAFPTGILLPYGGSIVPSGWLLCNGQAVSRATYATLFTALSTAFGAGDGSTTFNVPDMRSRLPMGVGTGTYSFTFAAAAVTTATDQITVTANPELVTGRKVQLTNSGGALPTGLAVATDYYMIVVDSTHIMLATSESNALLGNQIDITAQGSGTNTATGTLNTYALAEHGGAQKHSHVLSDSNAMAEGGYAAANPNFHIKNVVAKNSYTSNINLSATGANAASESPSQTRSIGLQGDTNLTVTLPPYVALNYIIKT